MFFLISYVSFKSSDYLKKKRRYIYIYVMYKKKLKGENFY